MRALSLILASTVTVALLVGASALAAARSEDAQSAVHVTGLETDLRFDLEVDWTQELVGRVEETRQTEIISTIDWSDARLPDQVRIRANYDEYPPSDANAPERPWAYVGSVADDAGSWVGTLTMTKDQEGAFLGQMMLEGTGANDGLFAILGLSATADGSMEYDGFLFEGELPPRPEPPNE